MEYIFAFLFILISCHIAGDYMEFQWFAVSIALGFAFFCYSISSFIEKRWIRGCSALGLFYMICNASYVALFRGNRYSFNPSAIKAVLSYYSLDQIFCVMMIIFPLFIFRERQSLLKAIGLWGVANSIYTTHGWVMGDGKLLWGIGYSGFLNYASVNGCLIACAIPFLPSENKRWMYFFHALAITACLLSKSSIPIGTLIVVYTALGLVKFATKRNVVMALSISTTFIISSLAIANYFDKTLFDSGSRFAAYKVFMRFWFHNANMFFGFGPGTFRPLAQTIQTAAGFMINVPTVNSSQSFIWLQMHCDYPLQILFEHGAVGLLLVTILIVLCAIQFIKYKCHKELASLLGMLSCSLFNFPLRYGIGSVIAGVLLYSAMVLEENGDVMDGGRDLAKL